MQKIMKKQDGITLIALIITIIIMLILAGVAISMAVGDNGIMQRVEQANISTERGKAIEVIQTGYYYDEKNPGNLKFSETMNAVKNNLEQSGYKNIQFEGSNFPLKVTATGNYGTYTYIITDEGMGSYEDGNETKELEISYEILDTGKIALKANFNKDGITNKELFEGEIGRRIGTSFSLNDDNAWRNLGNYIATQILNDEETIFTDANTEEDAIEYINKNYLGLQTTQSEDDTIASLLICGAAITVNGTIYDVENNGYLIEIEDENNTIEIKFGEITSTIEVKLNFELQYNKNYSPIIPEDENTSDIIPLQLCFKEDNIVMTSFLGTTNICKYTINEEENKFYIDKFDATTSIIGTIKYNSIDLECISTNTTDGTQTTTNITLIANDNSLFQTYTPEISDIENTESLFYGFKCGIYSAENEYYGLWIRKNIYAFRTPDGIGGTLATTSTDDETGIDYFADNGFTFEEDTNGKLRIYYNKDENNKVELTLVESFKDT